MLPAIIAPVARHPLSALSGTPGRSEQIDAILPPVIGHRGAAGCAPENTLSGFHNAATLGCRWVEFDVRLTSDRHPVLLHDNRLERTTDGRGRVSALPLAAIQRHDAGGWFHPFFAGERVPRLEEALALLAELDLGANVELKAVRGKEAATGALVAGLLARRWTADPARLLISSFHQCALAAARDHAPHFSRGILFRRIPRNWRRIAERLGCATLHVDHQPLRPAAVSEVRRAGYRLLAYTVNDPTRAKTLLDWGVTSLFSDVPHRLLKAAACEGNGRANITDRVVTALPRQEPIW